MALLRRKQSNMYAVIMSLSILARQNTSSLCTIGVCLKCILVLIKPKDFITVFSVSGLRVAEQANHGIVFPIRLCI